MTNSFIYPLLFTSGLSFLLATFLLVRNSKSTLIRTWSGVSFGMAIWSFSLFQVIVAESNNATILWNKILYIGAIFIPVFYNHFVLVILKMSNRRKKSIVMHYILGGIFLLVDLFYYSPLFFKDTNKDYGLEYWFNASVGIVYYAFLLFFAYLVAASFWYIIREYKKLQGHQKNQVRYVFIAGVVGFGGGITAFLPQLIRVYPFGVYFVIFYIVFITYAITRYRLMNIRWILTRSILYGVLVGGVAAFFALSVLVVGQMIGGNTQTSKIITYIVTSFIVVVFLEPVKRVWAKITDRIFYKDKVDYQQVLQQGSNVLTREIDLEKLLREVSLLLADKLKIKEVSIMVGDGNIYDLMGSSNPHKDNFKINPDIISYLGRERKILITEDLIKNLDDLDDNSGSQSITKLVIEHLENLKVEMVVPILEQEQLNAIFLLSAKQSGDLYDQNDINFFNVFAPQIATAIEKSKLYEEVEQFNVELQAKVEERTKSLKEANKGLEERNKFLATMQAVTNLISRTMDLKQVNQMIADSIARELGYVGGILSFIDREKNVLKVGAITNSTETKKALAILSKDPRDYEAVLEEGYSLGTQTVLSGKINFSDRMSEFLSPPVEKELLDKIQDQLGVKTVVGVPVFSEARIIGIIHFLMSVKKDQISSLDIETMTALTNQVGIVSRNVKLYNTLQHANEELQDANMRLRELDKAKSEFLSIASHQLRTPISALKGYLSMIIEGDFGKIPGPINKVVKDLFESASRLARLINVFLNVSRIESGRLKLEKKPLQIVDMVESVMDELKNEAAKKELKFDFKKPKKKVPQIFADSDKLREVVLNLIDNSIKYTPQGSVTASVEFDDKNLTFMVEDTGIGIKKDEVKALFRKFVRGSGVAQIHTGGSGLGLFIAQKIIKEHGGRIWAESDGQGKGSRFKFEIPLYDEKTMEYKPEER